MAEDNNSLIFM